MPSDADLFRSDAQYDAYISLAEDLTDTYQEAIALRNTFAETTRDARLRKDGRSLTESLNDVTETALNIVEQLAVDTPDVDAEYMRSEGWELSYHEPEDLPNDLVFACRTADAIIAAHVEINWLFDDVLGPSVPEPEEIPAAADRVANRFPHIARRFDQIGLSIDGVDPADA